jgi:thioredoxin 1
MLRIVTDANFDQQVLQSDQPIIVHFSLDCEFDSKIKSIIDALAAEQACIGQFVVLKMADSPVTVKRYNVLMAPTLLVFINGKVIGQIIGANPIEVIRRRLSMVLSKPSEDQLELSPAELKKAYKIPSIKWRNVLLAGLAAGVFGIIAHRFAIGAHIVSGARISSGSEFAGMVDFLVKLLGFFIISVNDWSWDKKGVALVLGFAIYVTGLVLINA